MKQFYMFLLCTLLIVCFCESQEQTGSLENMVQPRIEFTDHLDKEILKDELAYSVSSEDTFYIKKQNAFDMRYFLKIKDTKPKVLGYYMFSAFYHTTRTSSRTYGLRQWKAPIVIYFDKDIPKNVKRKLEHFYNNIPDIPNFSVHFTHRRKEANYLIKLTYQSILVSAERYGITDEAEIRGFFFNGCNYTVISDPANSIIGCNLEINRAELDNEAILYKKIKQGLFLSFGRFFTNKYLNQRSSFLNPVYDNQEQLSDLDVEILTMHYSQIFDEAIDGSEFNQLLYN